MIKKILAFLKTIKFKSSCCYESQCRSSCSINDKETLENNLDNLYNEISQDCEEFKEK